MYSEFRLEEMFAEADGLIKEGRLTDAVNLLEAIIAENPSFGKAYNHLGWVYETKLQDIEKAEMHYQLAIKFSPNYAPSYYNYAILLSTYKKYEELDLLLNRALKVPGINKGSIYNEYGLMYEALGLWDQAEAAFKDFILHQFDSKLVELGHEALNRIKQKKLLFNQD